MGEEKSELKKQHRGEIERRAEGRAALSSINAARLCCKEPRRPKRRGADDQLPEASGTDRSDVLGRGGVVIELGVRCRRQEGGRRGGEKNRNGGIAPTPWKRLGRDGLLCWVCLAVISWRHQPSPHFLVFLSFC